jgi:histidinol-phosphatase
VTDPAGVSVDPAALRAFALELADVADAISLRRFGGPVPSVTKLDGTPVTEADRAIEAALRDRVERAFPDHGWLGEETGGRLDPAAPTWVIDPIDATKNYLRGIPVFATLIAVVVDGRAVVGVASAPALGERWDAAHGQGARRNGAPVGVSAIAGLHDAHVLHGGLDWYRADPRLWELLGRLADMAWRTRGFGDFWNHLLVAGGMAEVVFESDLKPWDIAALECIVTEAGGRMTAFDGAPALTSGDVLTTNGLLHAPMQDLLRDLAGS